MKGIDHEGMPEHGCSGCTKPQIFGTSPFAPTGFEASSTMCTRWFWDPELSTIYLHPQIQIPNAFPVIWLTIYFSTLWKKAPKDGKMLRWILDAKKLIECKMNIRKMQQIGNTIQMKWNSVHSAMQCSGVLANVLCAFSKQNRTFSSFGLNAFSRSIDFHLVYRVHT